MNTFFRFIFSKLFLKQVLIAAIISFVLFIVTIIGLKRYTQHNTTIQVPDIIGYNNSQVERIIKERGLRYEIIDSVYTQEVLKGTVFDQIPTAGSFVKENRKIFVIINAHNQEMIAMPSLENTSLRQAKVLIEQNGLKIGSIHYVSSEYKDLVLKQIVGDSIISPGAIIPKRTEVSLHVGKGLTGDKISTPYLRGMYWIDAKKSISNYKLNEGAAINDETILDNSNIDSAIVWKQYPQPNVSASVGKSVDVWLTMDTAVVYAADSTLRPTIKNTNTTDFTLPF